MGDRWQEGPFGPDYWMAAFDEAGSTFLSADLEARRALYEAVLHYYNFTCAMTGAVFAAMEGIHPNLEVSAIQPLEAGGTLDVSNFIALSADADIAFQRGHLSVGPDFGLLADLSRIDPELLERLNPNGRLRLPADERAWPNEDRLAFHRADIFAQGKRA
jgi:predicted restriction endonuclease